jgi:hypothetical protein
MHEDCCGMQYYGKQNGKHPMLAVGPKSPSLSVFKAFLCEVLINASVHCRYFPEGIDISQYNKFDNPDGI